MLGLVQSQFYITIPVMPEGPTQGGKDILAEAAAIKEFEFKVNLMAMIIKKPLNGYMQKMQQLILHNFCKHYILLLQKMNV